MRKMKNILKLGIVAILVGACGSSGPAGGQNQQSEVATVNLGNVATVAKTNFAKPGINVPAIKVNTVGWAKDWKKVVIFNVDPTGAVVKDDSGKIVLKIADSKITKYGLDEASKDEVWYADISELKKKGTYTVEAADMKNEWYKSDPFVIGEFWEVQAPAVKTLIKSFYYQRTRTNIVDPYAKWNGHSYVREGVSHTYDDVGWDYQYYPEKKEKWQDSADKKWWPGEQIKKGWFDAGNFDMYIDSTGISAQILLIAYSLAPDLFKDGDQNIPESTNKVPDLLDEITWALDWIMSMQQKDGGFRHSEAVKDWTGPMPADEDKTVRWIRPESSSSTAKAVAVLAMASVLYKDFPAYASIAKQYEEAAKLGWSWLKERPAQMRWDSVGSPQPMWDDNNKEKNDKGEFTYNDIGARWAAAVEMWVRFRDKDALATILGMYQVDKFDQVLDPKAITTGAWPNASRYGLIELALDEGSPESVRTFAANKIKQCADEYLIPRWEKDGHKVVADINEYYWGFTANTAEKVHMLAMASKITGDAKYMEAARDNWHWLMGRNPNGYSMATGVGSKAPTKFYHLEWGPYADAADIPPVPGFAVGGPNFVDLPALSPDAPAKALLWDNQEPTRVGGKPHQMWHWKQEELWDGGFEPEGGWNKGWWCVTETDLLYSADFTLAGISVRDTKKPLSKFRAAKKNVGDLNALVKKYKPRPAQAIIAKNSPGGKAGYKAPIEAKETVGNK